MLFFRSQQVPRCDSEDRSVSREAPVTRKSIADAVGAR
jgi:hypothetical protein